MNAAALNPIERADQLLTMASRLLGLVEAEIKALKERRLDGGSADFAEKERLAHAWRLEVSAIKANPDLLAGARTDQKLKLRDVARALEEALESHALAIAAMKDVTEGLVRAIADEVAAVRRPPAAYGRSGALQGQRSVGSAGLAVNAKA